MMAPDTEDWEERASELHDHGIPKERAKAVALIEAGNTFEETKEVLGLASKGAVSNHISRYRKEDLPNAKWIAENAPDV